MAKEETIKLSGLITECLPAAKFRVKLETNQTVIGYVSGRMRQHDIMVLLGDRVELEFSPYDLSKGRIVRRC